MFRTLDDFLTIWQHESASTEKLLQLITDASLSQQVNEEGRTIARLAWHIVTTLHEMVSQTGLQFEGKPHDAPVPASAEEIAKAYTTSSKAMFEAITEHWNDTTLQELHMMYGQQWTVATILQILVFHQIHHRGQLTVLLRQAGIQIPGIYGPSKEEWTAAGMEPPVI